MTAEQGHVLVGSEVRTPALVCVVLSAGQIVLALVGLVVPAVGLGAEPVLWLAVLLAVLHVQQLAALLALVRSGATGNGDLVKVGLGLAALGGIVFIVAELLYFADPGIAETAFTIAPLASGLGMILTGVAVLRAGRWAGPARFLPLAIGVYIFAVLVPVLVATSAGLVAIAGWALLSLLLGFALYSTARVPTTASRRG